MPNMTEKGMPMGPRCAVYVVIEGPGGVILLGRNARDPHRGAWEFPGGGIDFRETIENAAMREVQEETGLVVVPEGQPLVFQLVAPTYHCIALVVRSRVVGGHVQAGDDLDEVRWFSPSHLMEELQAPENATILSAPTRAYLRALAAGAPVVTLPP